MKAVQWKKGKLALLDQTQLPQDKCVNYYTDYRQVAEAISTMKVRGAPAIGVTAAYGLALAALSYEGTDKNEFLSLLKVAKELLGGTRPTAVNLFWALNRMESVWLNNLQMTVEQLRILLEQEAIAIDQEDLDMNKKMGALGNSLIPPKANILTHCNAGALATAGYGTALGVIRAAHDDGKNIHVFADETRPLLQGARLTVWELMEDNIPVTLITDSMAAYLMQQKKIDLVIVGADRITSCGDVANKIGTYGLAVLAKYHDIPFYVIAPLSTIDMSLGCGSQIPIEERHHDEVRNLGGVRVAPEGAKVYNPAFDVTPSCLISAIITDCGILKPPYERHLSDIYK